MDMLCFVRYFVPSHACRCSAFMLNYLKPWTNLGHHLAHVFEFSNLFINSFAWSMAWILLSNRSVLILDRSVYWIWCSSSPWKIQQNLKQHASFFTSCSMTKLKKEWLSFSSTWSNCLIHTNKLKGFLFQSLWSHINFLTWICHSKLSVIMECLE